MKTRIISILLACVMLLALVPSLVLATDAEAAFTSSFIEDAQANITYNTEDETVTYAGDWQAAIIDPKTYTPTLFDRLNPWYADPAEGCWAVIEFANSEIHREFNASGNKWTIWWWGTPPGAGSMCLDNFALGLSNPQSIPMYVYTVKDDGMFSIDAEIEQFTAPTAQNEEYYFSVMVNEEMVWPVYGAAYSYDGGAFTPFVDTNNVWFHVTTETTVDEINEALATMNIKVEKGDRVEFCYRSACDFGDVTEHWERSAIFGRTSVFAMPKITGTAVTDGKIDQYLVVRENGKVIGSTFIEGDIFTLPAYTGSSLFLGWDVTGDGNADCMAGATLATADYTNALIYADAVTAGQSTFADHYPKLDAEGYPSFSGGWEIGCYFRKEATYLPFVGKADDYGIITIDDDTNVWTGKGGGFYAGADQTGLNPVTGCMPNEEYLGEIRYTVPYGGQVEFSMDQIFCKRQGATQPSKISYSFAVYVNGEKVWPTTGNFFALVSEETYTDAIVDYDAKADFAAAGFPLQLNVKSGDVISFRTQEANDQCWAIKAAPCVTYTSINESPVAMGSSVTLRTDRVDLDLNFYAHIINARENAAVGMEYWLTKPTDAMLAEGGTQMEGVLDENGFYRFTYGGFSAKQMADLIYVRPYSVVGEDKVYGNVVAYSIQQYAMGAMGMNEKLDNLLIALLNYGSHAQDYFEYKIDDLANAGLTADQKTMTVDLNTLTDVYENAEGDNKITNVSLLLGNELGMKYMINSVEGATTYELEYSKNADFTESTKIPMTGVWENRQQKAIYYIGLGEVDDTFYVRAVVDGVPGATLTYSVESYILRMQMCKDVYMWHTINGLGFLGQAIEAYQA